MQATVRLLLAFSMIVGVSWPALGDALVYLGDLPANRLLNALTPLDVQVPSSSTIIRLTDLRYCGPYSDGAAKILAVGVRTTSRQSVAGEGGGVIVDANLSLPADCKESLAVLTARPGFPADGVAAFLRASWKPWVLHLSMADLRAPSLSGGTNDHLSWPGVDLPTRPLTVALGSGKLPVAVAFGFHASTIAARLLIDRDQWTGAKASDFVPPAPSGVGGPSDLGLTALVDVDDLNAISTRYFEVQPLKVTTGTPIIGDFSLSSLSFVATKDHEVVATGDASLGSATFDLVVSLKGDDLAIDTVAAKPRHETCTGELLDRLPCMARNLALDQTAEQLTKVATAAYGGRLLRALGTPGVAPLRFGQLACDIETVVQRVDSKGTKVILEANLIFHRPSN